MASSSGLHGLAEADVILGDQNVGGGKLRDRSHWRRRRVRAARQIRGDAAGADGDRQDDYACPIHTLHFPQNAATLPPP